MQQGGEAVSKLNNDLDSYTDYFNNIYDDTFDQLKIFIASRCADTLYISDILQETYLEYYKMLLKKGTCYAKDDRAVLWKIAKRKVFHFYSLRQKLSLIVPLFALNKDGEEYCVADKIEDENRDYNDILNEIDAQRIWNIINTYPSDVRKIMYLYFSCGMSHKEIAENIGCSLSNVKNKLYRTLAEIREKEKL